MAIAVLVAKIMLDLNHIIVNGDNTYVISSDLSSLHMIGKTVHITEEQAKFIDSNCINLSKFVRTLLDQEMKRV